MKSEILFLLFFFVESREENLADIFYLEYFILDCVFILFSKTFSSLRFEGFAFPMGSNSSQPLAELSDEDIEFISSKAKIDHESVKVWYDKLKVSSSIITFSHSWLLFSGCLSQWKDFQSGYREFLTKYQQW